MGSGDPAEAFFKDGLWGWVTSAWVKLTATAAGVLKVHIQSQAQSIAVRQYVASTLLAGINGWDGSAWRKILVDADGHLQVEVVGTEALATGYLTFNNVMTSANTEYSRVLMARTKKFLIKCRGNYDIKVAFAVGESGTNYITVPAGMSYWEDGVHPPTLTLYFQCATAGQVAEIVAWT